MTIDLSRLRELLETIRQQTATFPFRGLRFLPLEFVSDSTGDYFQVRDESRSQLWEWEDTFDTIVEALENVSIWFERLNRPAHEELLRAGRERLKHLYWNALGTYSAETWADIKANKLPEGVKNDEMPGQEIWPIAIGDNAEPVVRFNWLGEFDGSHLREHIGQLRQYARLLLISIEGAELSKAAPPSDARAPTTEFWAGIASGLCGGQKVDPEFARRLANEYEAGERVPPAAGDLLPVGLDNNAVAVLFCLSNRSPVLLTLDDIVDATKVSRDTASNSLNELIDLGLAHRPKGKRKGATVTDKGRDVAAQIRR